MGAEVIEVAAGAVPEIAAMAARAATEVAAGEAPEAAAVAAGVVVTVAEAVALAADLSKLIFCCFVHKTSNVGPRYIQLCAATISSALLNFMV
jgi:hypothetical protein